MSSPTKDLAYFDDLPYTAEFIESDGKVVAYHPDLPGCATSGENIHDALANLAAARRLWLQAKIEDGQSIPEPSLWEPSGRLILRVPIRLHDQAEAIAVAHKKSLNGLLNEVLFNYLHDLPANTGLGDLAGDDLAPDATDERPLAIRLTPDEDGGIVAEHPDLLGCFSAGDDVDEALANLAEARELWEIERGEAGLPVPEPLSADHSGRINLRLSQELHGALAQDAQRNGATLNQLLSVALAEAVGRLAPDVEAEVRPLPYIAAITSALGQLRDDPHLDLDLTAMALPESHLTFMRALLCLGWAGLENRFDRAFDYVFAAFEQQLDFATDAVDIFRAMQRAPEVKEVWPDDKTVVNQLLTSVHNVRSSHPHGDLVKALLTIFCRSVLKEPQQLEYWRARVRYLAAIGAGEHRRGAPRSRRTDRR